MSFVFMRTGKPILELLHAKDRYNRISLRKAWGNAKIAIKKIKTARWQLDYGDPRIDDTGEKRRRISEGLKICHR